jgi:hypothetical protein
MSALQRSDQNSGYESFLLNVKTFMVPLGKGKECRGPSDSNYAASGLFNLWLPNEPRTVVLPLKHEQLRIKRQGIVKFDADRAKKHAMQKQGFHPLPTAYQYVAG